MGSTRQRRAWDIASYGFGLGELLGANHRHLTVDALGLSPGESVLDVGCGAGHDFGLLREAVGPHGRVVGVEFSPKLAGRARARIAEAGWSNVELRHSDATADPMGDAEFDAAVANCSLSAMPAMDAAIDNIHRALKPGGLLMVWDVNPKGSFRLLYRTLAGAPGVDVSHRIRQRFDDVHMLDGKAQRIAWRSPSPWFLLLLARKAVRLPH
ncbi:class I SAM-dependent methyltransferase [Nocardia sp. NPDC127526]|uniref:class I SAM-dependent methyltransferase n=1 Tax=Nocardia sp. NPDC127526 TaxID=3345393 RepID=UPI00362DAA74